MFFNHKWIVGAILCVFCFGVGEGQAAPTKEAAKLQPVKNAILHKVKDALLHRVEGGVFQLKVGNVYGFDRKQSFTHLSKPLRV